MLVIDRVELPLGHQLIEVRELKCCNSMGLQQQTESSDEIIDVGNVGEDIVGGGQIRRLTTLKELARQFDAEESLNGFDPFESRCVCSACRRLDAEAWDSPLLHILEEIAIVGSNLDYVARRIQFEPIDHRLYVLGLALFFTTSFMDKEDLY